MASSESKPDQETEWIRRAQRGDREAFGPLVDRFQKRVYALVYHLVRRRDEVEDIAQEIFIKAFRAIRTYDFRSAFGTWLSRVGVNHCYDYLRRQRAARVSYFWQMPEESQRQLLARAESDEPPGGTAEQRAVVRDLAEKLLARAPVEDRTILTLKELEGLSVEEIAEILNLKVSTAKVRLHRARKRMVKDLRRWQRGR